MGCAVVECRMSNVEWLVLVLVLVLGADGRVETQ
jgi:hypothetical protein